MEISFELKLSAHKTGPEPCWSLGPYWADLFNTNLDWYQSEIIQLAMMFIDISCIDSWND